MRQVLQHLRSTLVALLDTIAVTFTSYRIIHTHVTTTAPALLLAILLTGTYAKLFETIVAAMVATFCLYYFFIPPIRSITMADPQGWMALIVFLTVSVLATNVSARLRSQRDELISRQRDLKRLYGLSRSMLLSRGTDDVRCLMVNKCIEVGILSASCEEKSRSIRPIRATFLRSPGLVIALYCQLKHE